MSKHLLMKAMIATAFSLISCSTFSNASFSQNAIAPDKTLLNNTLVNFNSANHTYMITGGTQVGSNQFHSFQDFSVPTGNIAHFDTLPNTTNAIARVTGKNISDIDGTLKTNGNTNLYLINPNGIIFGANAKLDIAGSFSASTANSVKFPDGSEFSATNPQIPPVLQVSVPLGLQYGKSNTGAKITNSGNLVAGQDLVLNANRLYLQGTLRSGRDLILQAQDTLKIRDTSMKPFWAVAGRDLLVQGNQSVDIFSLNNTKSGFWSGENMILRSDNPIIGDAHFYSGGNLRIEKLNGTLGDLRSPHDPIVFAEGDVALADYTGASLHILAGGSVTLGNITINSVGDVSTTINPNNPDSTLASLAQLDLTEYQTLKNSDRTLKDVLAVKVPITIDGSDRATLDVRSGVDWAQLGGLPSSPSMVMGTTTTSLATSADITINGNIQIDQPNGLVLLTNQFKPNALDGKILIQGGIDVSVVDDVTNGGNIGIYGRGNIIIGPETLSSNAIALSTLSRSEIGDSGNAGNISIASNHGNITLFNTVLNTYSRSRAGNSGHGGSINISTNSGNILLDAAGLDSSSTTSTSPFVGHAGDGGDISLVSRLGKITLQDNNSASEFTLNSKSQSTTGNSGNGGAISLASLLGDIELLEFQSLNASSESFSGNASKGGAISLITNSGNIAITASRLISFSKSNNARQDNGTVITSNAGNGGAIDLITDRGNINIVASTFDSTSISDADAGITHNGGTISFSTNSGNLIVIDSLIQSSSISATGNAGDGGAISFSTNSGEISLFSSTINSYSFSQNADAGNGGVISFSSQTGDITLNDLRVSAYSNVSPNFGNTGNGGAISFSSQTGNIAVIDSILDSSSDAAIGDTGNAGSISLKSGSGSLMLNNSVLDALTYASAGNTGHGGEISFVSETNDITIDSSSLYSYSVSDSFGDAGNGGKISLASQFGNIILNAPLDSSNPKIRLTSLYSFSYSGDRVAGNGGDIELLAPNGNIVSSPSISSLISVAYSERIPEPKSGDGGQITLQAKNQIRNLELFTVSASGQAGKVTINGTGDLTIANLVVSTSKKASFPNPFDSQKIISFEAGKSGRSGDVEITGLGGLTFENSIFTSTTQGRDQAGNIFITSPSFVSFQNKSQILSNSNSTGNAGTITVDAGSTITIQDGSQITARTSGQDINAGKAGDIFFTAPVIKITGGSQVLAGTESTGTGGNIIIDASTSVDLTRLENAFPVLSVQTSNAGKAGNILINTPILTLSDSARITATATSTATNKDGGGSITLNASTMNLFGTVGVFAETQGNAPAGTLNLNPYNNQTAIALSLAPNSQISASTSGNGNGGSILFSAPQSITITGKGKLAVETTSFGNAGNIEFSTQNLTLSDGVVVSASTSGAGKAGDIFIQANNFTLSNGASVKTRTSSNGASGKIEVIVGNNFILKDLGTGLFADTEETSTGKGGDIFVDPILVSISNGAGISVNSLGKGNGGNIDIFAGKFVFSDNAFLKANTASGEGGNINLKITDIFFPRNNSKITATAGGTGNGGNINLSALFTVALPAEDNDIFANAFFGKGGNINITTQGIFGLEFRPRLTPLSDITASSEFGVQGNVNINTPGVDPSKGLSNLPADVSDASRLVKQECIADKRGSAFIITGKGGVPAKPSDRPTDIGALDNFGTLPDRNQTANITSIPTSENNSIPERIVEATGWIVNAQQQVVLIAGKSPAQVKIPCYPTHHQQASITK